MAIITGTELDDPNLKGTAADDTISGLGGRDHLYGGAGNDTLYGGAGDDAMHGDAGADIMFGGAGNDDYYVDDVNDVVSETTVPGVDDGGTNDRVYSTVSYTLSPFLERLVLLESVNAITATGNAQVKRSSAAPTPNHQRRRQVYADRRPGRRYVRHRPSQCRQHRHHHR